MTFFNYNFLCVQSFTLEFGVAVLTAFFTASDLYFFNLQHFIFKTYLLSPFDNFYSKIVGVLVGTYL